MFLLPITDENYSYMIDIEDNCSIYKVIIVKEKYNLFFNMRNNNKLSEFCNFVFTEFKKFKLTQI